MLELDTIRRLECTKADGKGFKHLFVARVDFIIRVNIFATGGSKLVGTCSHSGVVVMSFLNSKTL